MIFPGKTEKIPTFRYIRALLFCSICLLTACLLHDTRYIEKRPNSFDYSWRDTVVTDTSLKIIQQEKSNLCQDTLYPDTLAQGDARITSYLQTLEVTDTLLSETKVHVTGKIRIYTRSILVKSPGDTLRFIDSTDSPFDTTWTLTSKTLQDPKKPELDSRIKFDSTATDSSETHERVSGNGDTVLTSIQPLKEGDVSYLQLKFTENINGKINVYQTYRGMETSYKLYVRKEDPAKVVLVTRDTVVPYTEKRLKQTRDTAFTSSWTVKHLDNPHTAPAAPNSVPEKIQAEASTDSHYVQKISIPESENTVWAVDSTSWPGSVSLNREEGNIELTDSLDYSRDTLKLGQIEGKLKLIGTDAVHHLPYTLQRAHRGFTAPEKSVAEYWEAPASEKQFMGDSRKFTLTAEIPIASPARADSVVQVRSKFQLNSDFSFDITMDLPGNVRGGYSVAVFVSGDSVPLFLNLGNMGIEDIQFEGFKIYSSGAGIYFNGKRDNSPVTSFSTYHEEYNYGGTVLPDYAILQFKRKNETLSFYFKKPGEAGYHPIKTFIGKPINPIPDQLYLHMLIGSYSENAPIMVEWSSFIISNGELFLP